MYIYIYIHIQFIFAWLYIPTYLYMTLSVIRFPCACVRLHIVSYCNVFNNIYIFKYTRLSFRMVCISLPDWSGALRHHLQSMRCLLSTRFTAGRSVASLSKLRASGIDLGKSRANPGKDGKHVAFWRATHAFQAYFSIVAGFVVDDINFWLPFQCYNEIPSLLWGVQVQRSLDVHMEECWVLWD